jgi:hypothetical protein
MSTATLAQEPTTIDTLKALYDELWCATQNLHRSHNGSGSAAEEAGMAQTKLENAERCAPEDLLSQLAEYKQSKPLPRPVVFA